MLQGNVTLLPADKLFCWMDGRVFLIVEECVPGGGVKSKAQKASRKNRTKVESCVCGDRMPHERKQT